MSRGVEREHYTLLTAICVALFCAPFMGAAVNAILPELGHSLRAGATELSLINAVFTLGMAIFQLACGSMGDIWGHRRIFLAGAAIFGIACATLAFLPTVSLFLAVRFVQGCAGAMVGASGLALLASCSSPEKRPIYLGFSSFAVYSGLAFAPPVAGLIAGTLGWRWIFLGSALASIVIFILMKYTASHEWRPAKDSHYDFFGCLLYAIAMSGLTMGASFMGQSSGWGWAGMGVFAAFLVFFCLQQNNSPFPILNLRLLARNRVLSLSCLAAFINYASLFGVVFYFAIYAQVGKGLSVQLTGLILAIQPLVQTACTPVAARLCTEWSQGAVSATGAALCGLGLLTAAFLRLDSPWSIFIATQILLGSGMSFFGLANTAIILESGGKTNVGQTSALTGAVRTAGNLFSMILITLTLGIFLQNAPISIDNMAGFMASLRINFTVFSVFNLLAIFFSLARNRVNRSK